MDEELLNAVAEALREHGVMEPKAVMAAASAAASVLGHDRCVCRQAVHLRHHDAPVERCPWCRPGEVPAPRKRGTSTVPTGGLL